MIQKYFKIFDMSFSVEPIFNELGFLKKNCYDEIIFFFLKNSFLVFQLYVNNNNI